jgi:hypothetical protein
MTYTISTFYDKTKLYPVGHGYDLRSGAAIKALILHSTDGNYGSSFENEAAFLRDSAKVSAHFLVGKQGRIACIVPPSFRAWHSGEVSPPAFSNDTSIGVETHYTTRETWPQAGQDALTWLVRQLIKQFGITKSNIDTHRKVAIPAGRKPDPLQYTDEQFYNWRDALYTAPKLQKFVVVSKDALNIREGPGINPATGVFYPIALNGTAKLAPGTIIDVDKIEANGWCHLASGLGFVSGAFLQAVPE